MLVPRVAGESPSRGVRPLRMSEPSDLPTVCLFLRALLSYDCLLSHCCSDLSRNPALHLLVSASLNRICLETASYFSPASHLANILAYQGPSGAVWSWANHLRLGFDPLTWPIKSLLQDLPKAWLLSSRLMDLNTSICSDFTKPLQLAFVICFHISLLKLHVTERNQTDLG